MPSFDVESTVLVIEDNEEQYRQIAEHLNKYGIRIDRMKRYSDSAWFEFVSSREEPKVIVVDLELSTGPHADIFEGLKIIEERLWPTDRCMQFIVFSRHSCPARLKEAERFGPRVVFLRKEFKEDGCLSSSCLDRLQTLIHKCALVAPAQIEVPRLRAEDFVRDLSLIDGQGAVQIYLETVKDLVLRSVSNINYLAQRCSTFRSIGAEARQIGVAVFGSCGRLEMRSGSDLEFFVFFSSDVQVERLREEATRFWNRTRFVAEALGLTCEFVDKLREENREILHPDLIVNYGANRYLPVIHVEEFVSASRSKYPALRDKHLQILTESRSIFNEDLLISLKKRLVEVGVGRPISEILSVAEVLKARYLEELVSQFLMDASPREVGSWKGLKSFCYRVINILALRLLFISQVIGDTALKTDSDWEVFFERLLAPGSRKIDFFYQSFLRFDVKAKAAEQITSVLRSISRRYTTLLDFLVRFEKNEPGGLVPVDARLEAAKIIREFGELNEKLSSLNIFDLVLRDYRWLLEGTSITAISEALA